jgi:alpha-N-arabinofuranosidase
VTAVNPDIQTSKLTQIALLGANVESASAVVLTSNDVHAHNTFEHPNAVQSKPLQTSLDRGLATLTIPAAAVVSVDLKIG